MLVKNDFDELFYQASEQYGVPFTWLKAIAGAESDWIPTAFRDEPRINDASRGLMQILYKTAYSLGFRGDKEQLFDPIVNVDLGGRLLQELIGRFGEDFDAVYSAYNSGSATAYKTNAQVAAHVDRARRYLDAVNQVTAEVTASADEEGFFNMEAFDMWALLGIAALAGAVLYYLTRRLS